MRYCFDGGGHVVWHALQQVIVGYVEIAPGRKKPIVELLCERHVRPAEGETRT